jgi:hypothetical protein
MSIEFIVETLSFDDMGGPNGPKPVGQGSQCIETANAHYLKELFGSTAIITTSTLVPITTA